MIVDNGSTDATVDSVRASGVAALIEAPRNLGYGGAANLGAKHSAASGRHVLVLNPDVEIRAHSVARLRATLDLDPSIGVVAPRVLNADGTLQRSAYRFPSLATLAGQVLGVAGVVVPQGEEDLLEPGWAVGAVLLVRREAWDAVGGFDPDYFFFVEEVDLQRRLRDHGWRVVIDQRASAVHHGGTRVIPAPVFAHSHDGWERYFGVHHGRPHQVIARALLCLTTLSRALGWLGIAAARPRRRSEALSWARMFLGVLRISGGRLPGALRRRHTPYSR